MPVLPVQIIPPTFPDGYCPPTVQQFANDLQSGSRLSSSITLDKVIISDSPPSDHTKLWFKTSAGAPFTYPSIPLYFWHLSLAAWVAAHYRQPGQHTWEEFAAAGDIDAYDGGAAGAVTATSGPFWAIDTAYDGRSPMSPGVIAASNPAKTLGYGEDFGEGAHAMTAQEVAAHTHPLTGDAQIVNGDNLKTVLTGSGGAGLMVGLTGTAQPDISILNNKFTTTQQAMPVVHPVRGMSCIVRTARLFYVG